MSLSLVEVRQDLARRMRVRTSVSSHIETTPENPTLPDHPDQPEPEPTFVVEGEHGGLFLTAPASMLTPEKAAAWEKAATANENYLYLQGRFVEADRPNRNQAFWTSEGLEVGQPTVANGPLNWLHEERHIIGTLMDSQLVRETAAEGVGTHIQAMAAVWKFLYPREAQMVEKASDNNALWYSMECTSETVTCLPDVTGTPGCGETFPYAVYSNEPNRVCSHLRTRSGVRRFDNPTFLGGAVIVPPVQPGWAHADAKVMRQAAEVAETSHLEAALSREAAEEMVASVIQYANRVI